MTADEIFQKIKERIPEEFLVFEKETKMPTLRVDRSWYESLCSCLKDDPSLSFDSLMDLTAVDWPSRRKVDLVLHLYSFRHRHSLALHCLLERENPEIGTVSTTWLAANWFEREVYDLFGVTFRGHPDLRRILLDENWEGYPLRKDFTHPNYEPKPQAVFTDDLFLAPVVRPQPEAHANLAQLGGLVTRDGPAQD